MNVYRGAAASLDNVFVGFGPLNDCNRQITVDEARVEKGYQKERRHLLVALVEIFAGAEGSMSLALIRVFAERASHAIHYMFAGVSYSNDVE